MHINLYATFRVLAGAKTLTVDLPNGSTVREALEAVVQQCPVLRPHWLDAAGEVYVHVHVFVNGEDVQTLPQGFATPLPADSVLDFFPPVGGGSHNLSFLRDFVAQK